MGDGLSQSLAPITQSKLRATSKIPIWNLVFGSDCILFVRGLGKKRQDLSPKEESIFRDQLLIFGFCSEINQIRSSKLKANY